MTCLRSIDLSLLLGAAALIVWALVLVRSWKAMRHERRAYWIAMPITGFLTALGLTATAIRFGQSLCLGSAIIDADVLTALANMGRGAILTAGLIVLTHYRPPKA
jgi:hypothetical protein